MSVHGGPADWWTQGTDAGRKHVATKGIVQNGLVLNLDAGVSDSYPGSGTTWTDLSGNANNGTLTNGPTFSSANGGSLVFDGVDDYINGLNSALLCPGPIITATLCCWCKLSTTSATDIIIGMQNPSDNRVYLGVYNGFWEVGFGSFAWNGGFTGERASATTNLTNLCLSILAGSAYLYVNTNLNITKTTDTTVSLSGTFPIGAYQFLGNFDTANMGPNNISQVSIYNRALTSQEIQQNFNATRGRYGI